MGVAAILIMCYKPMSSLLKVKVFGNNCHITSGQGQTTP